MPEIQRPNMFRRASAAIDRRNDWFAGIIQTFVNRAFQTEKFRATKEAMLAVEGIALFSIGTTLMQIGEWFLAICAFVVLGFLLFAKALTLGHWAKNAAGCIGAVVLAAFLVTITALHKPESEPWSNLQKMRHRAASQQDNGATPKPTQSQTPDHREDKAEDNVQERSVPAKAASPHSKASSDLSGKPYDLTDERRARFLALLKPPLRNANRLKIACLSWSERACVAAGQFLILFSQAGWTIDQNKVFRMDEPIPTEGVSIVSKPEPGPPLPPHLGRWWHRMSVTEVSLAAAFVAVGVKQAGSGDPTLEDGTTGVYFSSEPSTLQFNPEGVVAMWASRLQQEITDIEQHPNSDPGIQSEQERDWNIEAEKWLHQCAKFSVSDTFHKCIRRAEKKENCFSDARKAVTVLNTSQLKGQSK